MGCIEIFELKDGSLRMKNICILVAMTMIFNILKRKVERKRGEACLPFVITPLLSFKLHARENNGFP